MSDLSARVEDPVDPHYAFQSDGSFVMTETTEDPSASHAEANTYPATVGTLGDGLYTILNDVLGPMGPGDLTWGFQWGMVLGSHGAWQLSKDRQIRPFIPEPMAMAGLVPGIGALPGYVRRRAA